MTEDNTGIPPPSNTSRESDDMYQRFLQYIKSGITIVNYDGVFLFANDTVARALGLPAHDLVDKTIWDVFPGDLADQKAEMVRKVIDHGGVVLEEWHWQVDGEWRWYDAIVQQFGDPADKPGSCIIVAHDITDRKMSEQLQSVLCQIADAVNTTHDLDELYRSIRDRLGLVVDTTNFCIALHDHETDTITLPYNVDERDKFDRFPAGKSLMSHVIKNNTSLLATEAVKRDLLARGIVETVGAPAKVWVGVPLKVRDRVIGAVSVQHYTDESAYTEKDLAVLEFASGQIAVAIERKQAEEALKQANDELELRVKRRTAELETANRKLRQEIEQRRLAEEALRESKRSYALATSAGRVGVWDWNMDTNDIYVDPGLKSFLGYEDHEIRNHLDHWGRLVHPEDAANMNEKVRDHLEGKAPQFEFEHRMFHKDGSIRWILARGTALRHPDGRPHRIVGTDTDITDRKQAEQALQESEERFRQLSDAAEEGIVIHDMGHIIDANAALARMFRYNRSELIGMRAESLTTPESLEKILKYSAANYDKPYEAIGIRKDGTTFNIQVTGKRCQYKGKSLRVGALRDITDLKQTEAKLRKMADELRDEREALAEKNAALKQILEHLERERKDYQQRICQDIQQAIMPLLGRLKRQCGPDYQDRFSELETSINALLSRDIDAFRSSYSRLTPREMEICGMIRDGLSSKQISAALTLSLVTVHKHREQIRKKLGLTNKSINLCTYLQNH